MIALGSVSASIITGGKLNIHQPEKPCNKKKTWNKQNLHNKL